LLFLKSDFIIVQLLAEFQQGRKRVTDKSLMMLHQQHLFTWFICTSLIALFCASVHTEEINSVRIQTTPVYAIASKADLLNSTTCGKELQNFRNAVDQQLLWSLKSK
jgi:hypothetical protein